MFPCHRTLLADTLMWARMVVIGDELREDAPEMALIHNQHAIQTLLADGSDPPLGKRVTLRRQQHLVVLKSHNSSK
jgi:hypothetical protein